MPTPTSLPDTILRTSEPGVLDLKIFVGGSGESFMRDVQIWYGTPRITLDLTNITPTAFVRTLDDSANLATIACTVVSIPLGRIRLTMAKAVADAIAWPTFGSPIGQQVIRGRWHLALTDTATVANTVVMLRGACEVLR